MDLIYALKNSTSNINKILDSKNVNVNIKDENGRTPLDYALQYSSPEIINRILDLNGDINAKDKNNSTPFMYAFDVLSLKNKPEMIKIINRMLDLNPDVNVKDNSDGWTPLTLAISFSDTEIINKILDLNPDINSKSGDGKTPLMYALLYSTPQIINHILDLNPDITDINVKDVYGRTPLDYALQYSSPEIINRILDLDGNKSFMYRFYIFFEKYRDLFMKYHGTLNESEKKLLKEIIEILDSHPNKNNIIINNLKNNFIVSFKGEKPYMGCELEVVFKDKKSEMNCLIELWNVEGIHLMNDDSLNNIGFEIITNPMGFKEQALFFKRVIHIINKYNGFCNSTCGFHIHIDKTDDMVEKVESIINQIDIELIGKRKLNDYCKISKDKDDRYRTINLTNKHTIELRFFRCTLIFKNILFYLLFAHNLVKLEEIEFITKYKKYYKEFYKIPLIYALKYLEAKEINKILDSNPDINKDINIKDENGKTPLILALENSRPEIINRILDLKSDVNVKDNEDNTPLIIALQYSTPEIIHRILDLKPDINVKGRTPLMFALQYSTPEIIHRILDLKPDINSKNNNEWTPLMYALKYSTPDIINKLLELNPNVNIKDEYG